MKLKGRPAQEKSAQPERSICCSSRCLLKFTDNVTMSLVLACFLQLPDIVFWELCLTKAVGFMVSEALGSSCFSKDGSASILSTGEVPWDQTQFVTLQPDDLSSQAPDGWQDYQHSARASLNKLCHRGLKSGEAY